MATLHVGVIGTLVDNTVMDRVFQPDVIGTSTHLCAWGVSKSTAFLFIGQESSSRDPEFVYIYPHVLTLVLPVCLGVKGNGSTGTT